MKALPGRSLAILLVVLLSFSLLGIFNVKAQEFLKISIKPDGTIEPETNLLERNVNTYTFKGDIYGTIWVQKGSITIDGAGYNLRVAGQELEAISGIEMIEQKNITITRLSINGFNNRNDAIYINKVNNITIENCTITDTRIGINVYHSLNIRLTQNKFTDFERTTIHTQNCTNLYITDNYISGSTDFHYPKGLHIGHSQNSTISQNTISDCYYGIEIHACYGITLCRNYFSKNNEGIYIVYGGENLVTENTVIDSQSFGIRLSSGETYPPNTIYHNNFINNNMENISEFLQVSNPWYFGPESNIWDNGKEGNYWSDYKMRYPEAQEVDNNGVYNIAFFINPENLDNYPLVNPWTPDTTEPTPSPSPEPTPSPESESDFPTIQLLSLALTVIIGLGILAYSMRRRP